jgi:AcrR family transcriptional regulator
MVSDMTDAELRYRGGKRERLVSAAGDLLHQQGVQGTTLAEIAQAAQVPPGNVYYYFKTRDDLVAAVIESRAAEIAGLLRSLDERPGPRARLKALAGAWNDERISVAAHGCPLGSLATELSKYDHGLDQQAARLLGMLIDWARGQFHELGRPDSRELAVTLISGIQGAALLANALHDPGLLAGQVRWLEEWIDCLGER